MLSFEYVLWYLGSFLLFYFGGGDRIDETLCGTVVVFRVK